MKESRGLRFSRWARRCLLVFHRDGEAMPGLLNKRDRRFKLNSEEMRKQRADLKHYAKPQSSTMTT